MDKTVLITGGCGFVGHALAKELIKRGYQVDPDDQGNCSFYRFGG